MADRNVFLNQSDSVDFKQLILKYLRYWYLFFLSLIVCLGVAFCYLYVATPQYRVTSTLLLKNEENLTNSLNRNPALGEINLLTGKQNIDNEIEVFKSKSLMHRVFAELSLFASYYVEGKFKNQEIYGKEVPIRISINGLKPSAYDHPIIITKKTGTHYQIKEKNGKITSHKFGEEVAKPFGVFTIYAAPDHTASEKYTNVPVIVQFHDIETLSSRYNESLKVESINRRASVIRISIIDSVPQKGKDIINKLLEVYNKEALEDRNLIAQTTIQFIDERLKYLTTELSSVEKNVEQYKRTHEVTDVTSDADQYLAQASDYNKQVSELNIKIEVLESIENYLNRNPGKYELVPSTLNFEDPTLISLITKYNGIQLERERMLRTTQPGNPLVQDLTDQLSSLRNSILENLLNIKEGLAITRKNLESTSGRFRSQIQKVPSIERELLEINREQGTKGNLYLYLLQKREESALALEITIPTSRMLDPATADDRPVSPKTVLIYLLAFVIGVGIPLSGIYIKDALNDKVQSKKDIQRVTNTPILGEISHNTTGSNVVISRDSTSPIGELFRLIRSNLQFATAGKENKVVLITSGASGEGKTFFTINLGASLTLLGKKVVLLELDLRRPSLLKQLGMKSRGGITDYLVNPEKFAIEDIIKPHHTVRGLYMASAGSIPPNPAELMMSSSLAYLINVLKESFDYILLDTPPVGQVADAFSLSSHIDSTIYLVRHNFTPKSMIELIDEIYRSKKLKHPMIVLNDSKESGTYGYGYKQSEKEVMLSKI
jgi:capsular exopolysaccharide synthesis family protein